MDSYTATDGTVYTMDTADRYELSKARHLLAYQWGRKTAAKALFDARFRGPVEIGGYRVAYRAGSYTITDLP